MNRKQKRVLFLSLVSLLLIVSGVLALRFLPYSKLMRLSSGDENVFTDTLQKTDVPPNTLFFDFEVAPGQKVPSDIEKGIAHSGQYATKAFGKNTFAFKIERTAEEIGLQNLTTVGLSAWVYVYPNNNEVNASFVFTVSNEAGVNVCWKGKHVGGPEVPRGEWFKISGTMDLDDVAFKNTYKIQIYFWNNSSTDILIDDYRIVFGTSSPKRGDSARVNMTLPAGFIRKFNYPPFDTRFFSCKDPGSGKILCVTEDNDLLHELVHPETFLRAGYFLSTSTKQEALLTLNRAGSLRLYRYCPEKARFIMIPVKGPPSLHAEGVPSFLLKGCFSAENSDELLWIDKDGIYLVRFVLQENPCEENASAAAEIAWQGSTAELSMAAWEPEMQFVSGDFNGDSRTELMMCNASGKWKLLGFGPPSKDNPWRVIAQGEHLFIVPETGRPWKTTLNSGKFLTSIRHDILLCIHSTPAGSYTLLRWNDAQKTFGSCFRSNPGGTGITLGFDTLKPEDQFLTGHFEANASSRIIRLNRDWRFDMKMLDFNDTTFGILGNLDFSDYEKDYNPKYYEIVRMVNGRFISPDQDILLVVTTNCRDKDFDGYHCNETENLTDLPDRASYYILQRHEP